MTSLLDAARAGQFAIGGDLMVNRLGFGAMRVTGPGVWGPPADRDEALRTLRRLPELGVDFIDTADSYGPDTSEQLIRDALFPYAGLQVATKAGLARTGPDGWHALGRAEYLRQQAIKSCRQLGVEQLGLWQLHRIDPLVPREEQFEAVRWLLDRGIVRHAGLSNVSVEDIVAAAQVFPVATVQNIYNLADRSHEDVLVHCELHGIGFIPWRPIAGGQWSAAGSVLDQVAQAQGATVGQVALAWLLRRSPVMLPIPGTSKVAHLEENVAAALITLSDEQFDQLSAVAQPGAAD